MDKKDTASPKTALESVLLTAVLDAKEGRDVVTVDIPNAFIQTDIPQDEGRERIILKIRGALVDMLVDIDPRLYATYVTYENEPVDGTQPNPGGPHHRWPGLWYGVLLLGDGAGPYGSSDPGR